MMLAEHPANEITIAGSVDDIIINLPARVNVHRDIGKLYDPMEAYAVLKQHKLIRNSYEFSEELMSQVSVFSCQGRKPLHTRLCLLGQTDFAAIYVSDPLVLTIGCHNSHPYIIDTRPVSRAPGNGTGLILTTLRMYGCLFVCGYGSV